jgi:hypothetical protein
MKSTLPAINGTPPRRGFVQYIPPLRGDLRGDVPFSFFVYSFFTNIGIFRIDYYSIDVKRIFFIINEDGKK